MITADPSDAGQAVRVSVIVVNYNAGEALLRCLRSVLETLPSDGEIVVVDNDSRDGSADLALRAFPSVRLERNTRNAGFGAASNSAARIARGEFLVFLNPDAEATPGWIEPLLSALADRAVGLATSKILLMDSADRINTCGNEVHYTGLTLCRGLGEPATARARPEPVAAVSGAAFAVRRDFFQELDGFDEDFFLYLEDTDLSLRARLRGRSCVYVPGSVVRHTYVLRLPAEKFFHQEKNRYAMLLKLYRWRTFGLLVPALFLAEMLTCAFAVSRGLGYARRKVDSWIWVLSKSKELLLRRRAAQTSRRIPDRELLVALTARIEFRQVSSRWDGRLADTLLNPLFSFFWRIGTRAIRW